MVLVALMELFEMSKIKEMQLEIIELIGYGFWPVDIEKRTGYPMEMILKVEEEYYDSISELHNEIYND